MNTHINVIGGGVAGLVASIEAAHRGHRVSLHESHSELGGRARTLSPYRANFGPHAVYNDGALWKWLAERGIEIPVKIPSVRSGFVHEGRYRRVPPRGVRRAVGLLFREATAPVGVSVRDWLAEQIGDADDAALACTALFPLYDSDPGGQDAAAVWEAMRRVRKQPARYVVGGWSTMVAALEARARELGVAITTGVTVSLDDLTGGPIVVATELRGARRLLGDDTLTTPSTSIACLDVGVDRGALTTGAKTRASGIDLDNVGFISRYTSKDRSLAPDGDELIQCTGSIVEGELLDDAIARIERSLEVVFPGASGGRQWSRRFDGSRRATPRTLPGETWRDRPAIDRGSDVYVVGDHVAAPGLLSEVSCASALTAVDLISTRVPARA